MISGFQAVSPVAVQIRIKRELGAVLCQPEVRMIGQVPDLAVPDAPQCDMTRNVGT